MSADTLATGAGPQGANGVVPAMHPAARAWLFTLRTVFVALLSVYVVWNLVWLAQLQLAPSLFQTLTGLPCPTTGCTRSLLTLCRGEWAESLRYNALTVPIGLLTVVTVVQLIRQGIVQRRLVLSRQVAWTWGTMLSLAWILKLAGDPRYW